MKISGSLARHDWINGKGSRSFESDPIEGCRKSKLVCSRCHREGVGRWKTLPPPEIIDQKFHQLGWRLDPALCPNCIAEEKEAKLVPQNTQLEIPVIATTETVEEGKIVMEKEARTINQLKLGQFLQLNDVMMQHRAELVKMATDVQRTKFLEALVPFRITVWNVRQIQKERMPEIYEVGRVKPGTKAEVDARIEALEKRVSELETLALSLACKES